MPYYPAKSALLIRETDNAGELVTHAERALRNQLQAADDEVKRLRYALQEIANTDYRGNRSTESIAAFNALKG